MKHLMIIFISCLFSFQTYAQCSFPYPATWIEKTDKNVKFEMTVTNDRNMYFSLFFQDSGIKVPFVHKVFWCSGKELLFNNEDDEAEFFSDIIYANDGSLIMHFTKDEKSSQIFFMKVK